ncbi:MAG: cobalt transport protein [Clostridia bacterium]|jgi:cobalt/nickel transport protein|nr:cobalt transport protein [Clostridia bacterium]
MSKKQIIRTNMILLIAVVMISVVSLYVAKEAEFTGADTKAENLIIEISPEYQPWFKSLFEPPSGEIESLLFALQAALGAGFIGYYIGYKKAK